MTDVDLNHETVLLTEAVELLVSDPGGLYVDATFGRGGHARKVLERLNEQGRLIGIDKDPEAVQVAQAMRESDARFDIYHGSFAAMSSDLDGRLPGSVSGVLADLGVSSPQLDDAARGFSFQNDGPLDMRMNTQAGESAAQWIARVPEKELADVLWQYGEERFSRRIAAAIVEARAKARITTTKQLAQVISDANPSWEKHKHPATRCFQAIRIHVNNELGDLETFLQAAADKLSVGGRLVVISFHSLEDRMVKRFMRDCAKGAEPPAGVPVRESDIHRQFKLISKPIKAGKDEVQHNVRARSAVMRALERVAYA